MSKIIIPVSLALLTVAGVNVADDLWNGHPQQELPELPDAYVFATGNTSASATAGVIMVFPAANDAQAPAHEPKSRPAVIDEA
jgi:hypothetical protein